MSDTNTLDQREWSGDDADWEQERAIRRTVYRENPDAGMRVPILIRPEVRDKLRDFLLDDPAWRGIGYSEFISVAIDRARDAHGLGDASVERGTDPSVSVDDVAGILAEPSPEPLAYLVEGPFSGGSGRLRCAMLHPPLRADLYSVTPLYALRPPSTAAKP